MGLGGYHHSRSHQSETAYASKSIRILLVDFTLVYKSELKKQLILSYHVPHYKGKEDFTGDYTFF